MFGRTLSFYFARHFAKMVGAIFLLAFLITALVTYFEFINRVFQGEGTAGFLLAVVALFKVPSLTEDSLPFAVLYGSIAAFVIANRRLEVVVARAAGVSAWQFLLPACAVGLLFGVLATTLYNPLAAELRSLSNQISAKVFSDGTKPVQSTDGDGAVWLRQQSGDSNSIIGAVQSYDGGLGLVGATAYVFDGNDHFRERVDAPTAHYAPGAWHFSNATVTSVNANPKQVADYELSTDLSPNEVKQTFLQLDSVSFWTLPDLAAAARRAGLSTDHYDLQYNVLLSKPILLLAMVLIAANVSLRFSRSRDLGRVIIAGVGVGFMLYVVTKIAWDLGSGGLVSPALAAWLPAIVATLAGVTVLLHLEDG
ncbi:MAG TPA: LPS export ABC transporter permease LptG [Bauldia sp.]|nr:LPS export ABC transporter permease LptG [Bauldia sp.]